jgi:hypothetical protein
MNAAADSATQIVTCPRLAFEGGRRSDAGAGRSENRSAFRGPARTGLRTISGRRPPRQRWDLPHPRRSLWQLHEVVGL